MQTATHLRLALVNAVGFSASTVMPLWLADIAGHFAMPATFASQAVLAQIGGAALFNILTPALFRAAEPLQVARGALLVAALAYFFAMTSSSALFLSACLVCGASLGVLLNITNRLMGRSTGGSGQVHRGYAIFVLVEVCFATLLFIGGASLIERFGLLSLFPAISAVALAGLLLLPRLATSIPSMHDATPVASNCSDATLDWAKLTKPGLGLCALALFFIGQSALNSFLPTFGQAVGLTSAKASQTIALGMPFGFIGAMLARVLGERVRRVVAICIAVTVLASLAPALAMAPRLTLFVAVVVTLALSTMFCVPYFFAQLGAFDRNGRYTAFGPAMMLSGIAIGPSAAVMLNDSFGLAAVGVLSASLLIASGACFALTVARLSARPCARP